MNFAKIRFRHLDDRLIWVLIGITTELKRFSRDLLVKPSYGKLGFIIFDKFLN